MSSKKILKGDTTQDGGLDCLHLSPSKLVVGGCSDGGEVGSQLGGCLIATSAQGGLVGWWESEPTTTKRFNIENCRQYIIPFRSIFLSEDGRKMGRWRCPARVTAVLLCIGWQAGARGDGGDGGVEEDQLLLAGDVQVATFFICNCSVQDRV